MDNISSKLTNQNHITNTTEGERTHPPVTTSTTLSVYPENTFPPAGHLRRTPSTLLIQAEQRGIDAALKSLEELKLNPSNENQEKITEKLNNLITKFEKGTVEQQEQIAQHVARNLPEKLFEGDKKILRSVSDPTQRFELAEIVANTRPDLLARHIQAFDLKDEPSKVQLAKMVVEKDPEALALSIAQFNIADERERVALATVVAKEEPSNFHIYIGNFNIKNESDRLELIKIIAKKAPSSLRYHKRFVSNEANEFEVLKIMAHTAPGIFSYEYYDKTFKIENDAYRFELAKLLMQNAPASLLRGYFNFLNDIRDEGEHAELAKIALKRDPILALETLKLFKLSEEKKLELYPSYCYGLIRAEIASGNRNFDAIEKKINKFTNKHLTPDQIKTITPFKEGVKNHPMTKELFQEIENSEDRDEIKNLQLMWLNGIALRLGSVVPANKETANMLKSHLEVIRKLRLPVARFDLGEILSDFFVNDNNDGDQAKKMIAFDGKFTRAHTKPLVPLIFSLYQDVKEPATQINPNLLQILRDACKDKARRSSVIRSLLPLAQSLSIEPSLKRQLLEATLPLKESTKDGVKKDTFSKESVHDFVRTISALQSLILVGEQATTLGYKIQEFLPEIKTKENIEEKLLGLYSEVFDVKNVTAEDLCTKLEQHNTSSRQPDALLNYAIKIQTSNLSDYEKMDVKEALSKFINATMLASDSQDFHNLRYSADQSQHMRTIQETTPAIFDKWKNACEYVAPTSLDSDAAVKEFDAMAYLAQRVLADGHIPTGTYPLLEQVLKKDKSFEDIASLPAAQFKKNEHALLQLLNPGLASDKKSEILENIIPNIEKEGFTQFHRDLVDLKAHFSPPSNNNQAWKAVDTDAPEDLFLCGTEVTGSCQNIYGDAGLNKALMGYVLDGKYRALVIKSDEGKIIGRRMLRMLWDEKKQKPVLQLERLYENPGLAKAAEQALLQLAKQKAQQLGVPLVGHTGDLEEGEDSGVYPNSLKSLDSIAPFEYVDALGGTQSKEYAISDLKTI